ncbi:hypothetical protein EMCRGX_G007622 [Ephydatia muelleri]
MPEIFNTGAEEEYMVLLQLRSTLPDTTYHVRGQFECDMPPPHFSLPASTPPTQRARCTSTSSSLQLSKGNSLRGGMLVKPAYLGQRRGSVVASDKVGVVPPPLYGASSHSSTCNLWPAACQADISKKTDTLPLSKSVTKTRVHTRRLWHCF